MLIAKINPPAIKVVNPTPFSSTTKNLEYMTAAARPYIPGASETNFQLQFGNVTLNDESQIVNFNGENQSQLSMTSEELTTWGTNDDTLLRLICAKLGVSVVEIISVNQNNF
jgi:hypothetical protein